MDIGRDWRSKSACRGHSIVLFYGLGENEDQIERLQREAKAKSLCACCPVQEPCLHEALVRGEEGVWGGMSKYDRKKLLRSHKQTKPKEASNFLKKYDKISKAPVTESVITSRVGWDGEQVLIKLQEFSEIDCKQKWVVEKNGQVLYETSVEDDAWLMFGSWTVTF